MMSNTQPEQQNSLNAAQLKAGQQGVIKSIQGDDALRRRLNALGMVKGTTMVVDHTAPLGDPRSYFVLGYRVCLRREEALQIRVHSNI